MKKFHYFTISLILTFVIAPSFVTLAEETVNTTATNRALPQIVTKEKQNVEKETQHKSTKKSFKLKPSEKTETTQNDSKTKVNSAINKATTKSQNKVNSSKNATSSPTTIPSISPHTNNIPAQTPALSPNIPTSQPTPQQDKEATHKLVESNTNSTNQNIEKKSSISSQNPTELSKTSTTAETKINNSSSEIASAKATSDKKEEETPPPPEDLPEVDSSELDFPEVPSASSTEPTSSLNYLAGLIGWGCLLIGVLIIIFVMLKGRYNSEMPVQKVHGTKKKRRKNKHILPKNYYNSHFFK